MIVAGFGGSSRAVAESYRDALDQTGMRVDALAVPDNRAGFLRPLAQELDLPLIALSPQDIAGTATLSQSPRIIKQWQTGSVAEACALIAAGPAACLLAPRRISADRQATCAIARKGET